MNLFCCFVFSVGKIKLSQYDRVLVTLFRQKLGQKWSKRQKRGVVINDLLTLTLKSRFRVLAYVRNFSSDLRKWAKNTTYNYRILLHYYKNIQK